MPSELHLPASCTIVNVNTLYEQLKALSAEQQDAVLDASQVTTIDTAALQTLAAFIQHQRESGLDTRFISCSRALIEAAEDLGMSGALGIN